MYNCIYFLIHQVCNYPFKNVEFIEKNEWMSEFTDDKWKQFDAFEIEFIQDC